MVRSTHVQRALAWRQVQRCGCRLSRRRVVAALLAVAVTWAVVVKVMDTDADQEKHSSGSSHLSRSIVTDRIQADMLFDPNRINSSKRVIDASNGGSNLRSKLINNNFSNSRYTNVILGQFEQYNGSSRDTIERLKKRAAEQTLNTIADELNQKELQEAEQEFARRRNKVRETCFKYGLGIYNTRSIEHHSTLRYPPTANYDVLYINRRDGFTYCPVYKVASTTWLHYLCQLGGSDPHFLNSTSQQISTIARKLWPQLDYDEASMVVPTTLKFMLVRHPFERIISAYRDKLENINIGREHGVLHFYESYGKKIVHKYRQKNETNNRVRVDEDSHLPGPSGIEPTFQEFVRYLINTDLVHYADDHWMPYYLYCTPCFIEYDVIAHFDSLERDQKFILHKLKLNKNLQRPRWKHLTKGKKTSAIVEKYLNTLSKVEKHKIYEKYKIDFEMFNFQP
ncbi:Sulfotransferase [Trinorchestia longiramus]|nr:Sulfotransferase [Trinorchestia longiramus]